MGMIAHLLLKVERKAKFGLNGGFLEKLLLKLGELDLYTLPVCKSNSPN